MYMGSLQQKQEQCSRFGLALLYLVDYSGILKGVTEAPASKKPGKPGGIRAAAREQMNNEIKRIAWGQLREHGPDELSLRAISREMDMTSSALYRYFPNRDALLTALIVDAYNDLGDRIDAVDADLPAGAYRARFVALANTILSWSREDAHRFGLVYGSPISGYVAPQDTINPGTRAQVVLYRLLSEWRGVDQDLAKRSLAPGTQVQLPPDLEVSLQQAAREVGIAAPAPVVLVGMKVWSELMGTIYSTVFNHFGNEISNGEFGSHLIDVMANGIFGVDREPETG